MKWVWNALGICFVSFTLIMGAILIYLSQIEMKLGDRIGKDWYYLKGYYEKQASMDGSSYKAIVTEQGIGVVTIPLAGSIGITLLYLFIYWLVRGINNRDRA
ncbi:hypothetical protein [Paenibacillus sp. YYML68]|uniref:hypothetical protein n=1 Tax=Paenibacillus sp. YYML68 TaxID=2909250 RepID=UPI0024920040|nr:hypothetical protein [Paenibacillus sp. YYML68]